MLKKVKGNAYVEVKKGSYSELNIKTGMCDFSDEYRAMVKCSNGTYRVAGPWTTNQADAKQAAVVSAS